MKTKLYRGASWYKPLNVSIGNKGFGICSFVFYNEEGIILKYEHGYLDNNYIPEFYFEVVKKIKESFNKEIAYIIKSKTDTGGRYDLYIHENLVGLKKPIYKIHCKSVYAYYYTDIENFNFSIYKKSLEDNLNKIKKDIEEETKKLTRYDVNSNIMTEVIVRLQELQQQLKIEEDFISSYTIDDYISKEVI